MIMYSAATEKFVSCKHEYPRRAFCIADECVIFVRCGFSLLVLEISLDVAKRLENLDGDKFPKSIQSKVKVFMVRIF